ncbi:NUDIX hydrolase [Neobacillus sp. LXY-4]|uniref:NUDIX hydrolase n=1 Tax=Neobacillus sp. LXY-4 TaxID=3379826 RepID=UPI003EE04D2F
MTSIYQNPYFNVKVDRDILSLENKLGGSAILPVTPEVKIMLLHIYRPAIQSYSLEIPRGFGEIGEAPEETAKREIMEEISCGCKRIESLGTMYVDSGLMNTKVNLFIGLGTTRVKDEVQKAEGIKEVQLFSYDEVRAMALNGQINDSFTLAAILRSWNHPVFGS